MGTGRARLSASILDSDLSNLAHVVRRLERAGADRIHLDVMDGHFVPNLTFGAKVDQGPSTADGAAVRRAPDDQRAEPVRGRLHRGGLRLDHLPRRGRRADRTHPSAHPRGRAGRPGWPSGRTRRSGSLAPYRELLDIVLVMTVEPGFGGQSFMKEAARKIVGARKLLGHLPLGGEVHVDGGINRETAEFVGGLGVDILVVGSALFQKGHDMGREIRLVKALADEGYAFERNARQAADPAGRVAERRQPALPGRAGAAGDHRGRRDPGDHAPGGRPDEPGRGPRLRAPRAPRRSRRSPSTVREARSRAYAEAEAWRATFAADETRREGAPPARDPGRGPGRR